MTEPEPSHSGRTYLILGATGGIGSELTRRLAAQGARVVAAARGEERLAALEGETGAVPVRVDATLADEVEQCARTAVERYGSLHGVANCVGSLLLKPAHLTTDEDWNSVVALNLGTAFAAVRAAARTIDSDGSVVLVSSAAARIGLPNHEAIAAAKAGVIGLMLAAAASYAPRRIRCNAVAPGLVRTPLTQRITANPTAEKASVSLHALGRLGEPGEVAEVIAWLLGAASGWITGQVIGVDGGLATIRSRG